MACTLDEMGRTGVVLDADGTIAGVDRYQGVTWSAHVPGHPIPLVLPLGGELSAVSTREPGQRVQQRRSARQVARLKGHGDERPVWVAVNETGNWVAAVNGHKVVELHDMLGNSAGRVNVERRAIRAYPRPRSRGFFLIHDDGSVSATDHE